MNKTYIKEIAKDFVEGLALGVGALIMPDVADRETLQNIGINLDNQAENLPEDYRKLNQEIVQPKG